VVDGRSNKRRRLSDDPRPSACLLRARSSSSSTARWAGVAIKGMCSHLGNRAPAKRKRDVLVELAHERVRRQTRVAHAVDVELGRPHPSRGSANEYPYPPQQKVVCPGALLGQLAVVALSRLPMSLEVGGARRSVAAACCYPQLEMIRKMPLQPSSELSVPTMKRSVTVKGLTC
jgi:hypothetical protein